MNPAQRAKNAVGLAQINAFDSYRAGLVSGTAKRPTQQGWGILKNAGANRRKSAEILEQVRGSEVFGKSTNLTTKRSPPNKGIIDQRKRMGQRLSQIEAQLHEFSKIKTSLSPNAYVASRALMREQEMLQGQIRKYNEFIKGAYI